MILLNYFLSSERSPQKRMAGENGVFHIRHAARVWAFEA